MGKPRGKPRSSGRMYTFDVEKAKKLLEQGLTQAVIATRMGVARSVINRLANPETTERTRVRRIEERRRKKEEGRCLEG